jgi:riboflavin biosynthesis pyrimidine reductase
MHRLWPDPRPEPLDEPALVAMYETDRSRPWLRVNFVTSLDGAVSREGYSEGLSGPADKLVFGLLRMLSDAVLVGAGTVRHERYGPVRMSPERRAWRLAHRLAEHPTLVVVSRRLDLDPTQTAFSEAPVRPIVLTDATAPQPRRDELAGVAEVVTCGTDGVDFKAGLALLRERGLHRVLSEGGPQVLGALAADDLLDELCLTLSPMLVGPGPGRITAGPASPDAREMALRHVLAADDMLLLRYART